VPGFAQKLILWQRRHGRHGLPWQGTRDPYRVWLSEVMLQQTQVAAVVPYYQRFLARFPDVETLGAASEEEVLALWSGLGYYARGRNLLHAARAVAARGGFPRQAASLAELPGVGPSTAAAIAAFAFGERAAILDGNVKRVLARRFGAVEEKTQWALARRLLPSRDIETYTQALMDFGATLCTRASPSCERCPLARECVARREDRIAELPVPRRRKALPLRTASWLVLLHRGEVLLERRPSEGLWGGLWVFPEGGIRRREWRVVSTAKLAPVEHGFTHFRLRARPLRVDLAAKGTRSRSDQRKWFPLALAARAAVPAPVRSLLLALR
jgi:A/G-specific adenine glycosylase